jgi:hypothetical protein
MRLSLKILVIFLLPLVFLALIYAVVISSDKFWTSIGPFYFFCAGAALYLYDIFARRRKKIIDSAKSCTIGSMPQGMVELHGQAVAKTKLTAPFSLTDCVAYSFLVERYRPWAYRNSNWELVLEGNSFGQPFELRDNTGAAAILPHGCDFDIGIHYTYSSAEVDSFLQDYKCKVGTLKIKPLPEHIARLLDQNGIARRGIFVEYPFHITEGAIKVNDDIFVLGDACTDPVSGNLVVKKGGLGKPFIITEHRPKKFSVREAKWESSLAEKLGLVLVLIGIVIFLFKHK